MATPPTRPPAPARVVIAGSLALTATVVPAFLTGALSGRIGDDLGFGSGAAGAAVAAFFIGAGAFAVPMGRLTERIGPSLALRAGVALSAVCALAVGIGADSWWELALGLLVAGAAVGMVDTGAARAFGDAVPDDRHGIAFGAKEASIPAASLLAGLSLPAVVDGTGWRPTFALGAVVVPVVWLVLPRLARTSAVSPPADDEPDGGARPKGLVLFAVGAGLGCGAATAAGTLLVPALEDRGWTEGTAGVLLAVASLTSITVRLLAGRRSDAHPDDTWALLVALLVGGAVGAVVLATGAGGPLVVLGTLAVIGAGWGWTGVAYVTAVRSGGQRPAAAAGVVLAGLSIGGAAGPAAFGAVASAASYGVAWLTAGLALVLGAAAIAAARHRLAGR